MDNALGGGSVLYHNAIAPSVVEEPLQTIVYIWDMDETLILLKSLLDGTYANASNGKKDPRKGTEIGKYWEDHILQVCDKYFFYEQIENYNEPFLSASKEYDDGKDLTHYDFNNDGFTHPYDDANKRKLAYRHRVITEKYKKGLQDVLDHELMKYWDDLYNLTDNYTDGWLSSGRAFLEETSRGNKLALADSLSSDNASASKTNCRQINVLVTSGSLIPSLVKCMLFRLDDFILPENVYSSWEVGKFQCFKWIKELFGGTAVRFCVIGDGMEECDAAQRMNWPFIKIDLHPSGSHRFPGLTMRMVQYYIDVIYGTPDSVASEQ